MFVQRTALSCFPNSLVQETTLQSNRSCEHLGDSQFLCKVLIKPSIISASSYKKFFVSKEFCIAQHDAVMCSLRNCRYHILLLGIVKELLQKLDAFCFTYQHVECLYTLFRYLFSGKIVVKNALVFKM